MWRWLPAGKMPALRPKIFMPGGAPRSHEAWRESKQYSPSQFSLAFFTNLDATQKTRHLCLGRKNGFCFPITPAILRARAFSSLRFRRGVYDLSNRLLKDRHRSAPWVRGKNRERPPPQEGTEVLCGLWTEQLY